MFLFVFVRLLLFFVCVFFLFPLFGELYSPSQKLIHFKNSWLVGFYSLVKLIRNVFEGCDLRARFEEQAVNIYLGNENKIFLNDRLTR